MIYNSTTEEEHLKSYVYAVVYAYNTYGKDKRFSIFKITLEVERAAEVRIGCWRIATPGRSWMTARRRRSR